LEWGEGLPKKKGEEKTPRHTPFDRRYMVIELKKGRGVCEKRACPGKEKKAPNCPYSLDYPRKGRKGGVFCQIGPLTRGNVFKRGEIRRGGVEGGERRL